ncbi:MAG: hypothetical protein I8H71_01235 [Xanthomonadaceae bacterium]|nr:hypothetical protein [Xanthomonadaceae bacterium]
MTRKRSKYRPRPVYVDPIAHAIAGARPVSDEKRLRMCVMRQKSLLAYAEGRATELDISVFEGALLAARELAMIGIGIELLDICDRADKVVAAARQWMAEHGDTGTLGPAEYPLLLELCELLDLQYQSVPLSTLEAVLRRVVHAAERRRAQHPACVPTAN